MPRDPFAKVAIGDQVHFAAQWYNAATDAAKAYQQRGGSSANSLIEFRSSTIIRVRNDTGAAFDRLSVVGLDGPIFSPASSEDGFLREVTFSAAIPDKTRHKRRYAITLDPSFPPETYGENNCVRAYLAGVCQVKVEIMDESHQYANIVDGTTDYLRSSVFGHARILWAEWEDPLSGYGYSDSIQWCIVMLGVTGSCTAIGKARGDIDPRSGSVAGKGQVDLYRSLTGIYSDASLDGPIETIDVLNSSAEEFGAYGTGIPNGMEVSVWWDADDVAWVAPLECSVH